MRVKKRNDSYEEVSFDKITHRLKSLIEMSPILELDVTLISQKVCSEIYDGIETSLLDKLTSEIVIAMLPDNLDYGELASRLVISDHHKKTSEDYLSITKELYDYKVISEEYYTNVLNNIDIITQSIDYEKDYKFDYFGYKTLEKSYLFKVNGVIVERPQQMYMRVALSIHRDNIELATIVFLALSAVIGLAFFFFYKQAKDLKSYYFNFIIAYSLLFASFATLTGLQFYYCSNEGGGDDTYEFTRWWPLASLVITSAIILALFRFRKLV